MSYKRFTHNPNNLEIANPCYLCKHKEERPIRNKQKCSMEECDYLKCYEKLAELEDKIENGTLIDLPCKVGDTVYEANYKNRKVYCHPIYKIELRECLIFYWIDGKGSKDYGYFGMDTFLTEAEAKKALKEQQNER